MMKFKFLLALSCCCLILSTTVISVKQYYCGSILHLSDTNADTADLIQSCIDDCLSGCVLTLPVGRYSLSQGLVLSKPIKIVSEGVSAPCSLSDLSSCTILQALPSFYSPVSLLSTLFGVQDIWLERIVIDGNRQQRLESQTAYECANNVNNRNSGRNLFMEQCIRCTLANSIVANAVCASGFVLTGSDITVQNSIFLNNGEHNSYLMWAGKS